MPPEMTDPPAEIPELPADRWIDRLVSLLEPVNRVTRPQLYGVEHVPADRSLLVGNHTIYGFLDLPFMMADIWKHRRLAVRERDRACKQMAVNGEPRLATVTRRGGPAAPRRSRR